MAFFKTDRTDQILKCLKLLRMLFYICCIILLESGPSNAISFSAVYVIRSDKIHSPAARHVCLATIICGAMYAYILTGIVLQRWIIMRDYQFHREPFAPVFLRYLLQETQPVEYEPGFWADRCTFFAHYGLAIVPGILMADWG